MTAGLLSTPMFIVNNYTFSGCSATISRQQAECQLRNIEEFTEEQICQETIKHVDIDAIFD